MSLGGPASALADRPDDKPLLHETDATSGAQKAAFVPEVPAEPFIPVEGPAPVIAAGDRGPVIPNQYIVVFKNGISRAQSKAQVKEIVTQHGGRLLLSYEHVLNGYAVQMPEEAVFALQRNRNVSFIEQDFVVAAADTQTGATWGIDRLDQRDLPLNSSYTYNTSGSGVHAYIIDTGIRLTHSEFVGRIGNGFDAVTAGGNANDCNGHGTHVAGTVGGTTYGVAKKVMLHPVRVLDCNGSGSNSGVIAGVDWVTANHSKPAVASMSLGGSASSALDSAVQNSIGAGVTYAIAAGNSSSSACNYSPARVSAAITVGSVTSSDTRASSSNFGSCLDLFAPGVSITSAWYTGDSATNTLSGTSMATPHVAGVAALYLSTNPTALPQMVRDAIVNGATNGKVIDAGTGSPNKLLYSLFTTPLPNVIVNPGFESGSNMGWTESSGRGYAIVATGRPRTGSYSAWTGGYNSASDYVQQRVTVPTNGTLSYWWRMETQESGTTVYDRMYVRLYDGSTGALITTLRTWSNASPKNVWGQDSLSLASYAGRSVIVRFQTTTDSSLPSSFFVDDVSLQ
ncbi:MAG: S8 family peptidase, partial [Ardenticatenales bacterium]|nr:S8 family peptidase [Ardenticatenales bacterium]